MHGQYNEVVAVSRMSNGTGNKLEYSGHIAELDCLIQPMEDTYSMDLPGTFGKNWLLMCDPADIQQGDQVIWNSVAYKVISSETLHWLGHGHTEVRIRQFE